MCVITNKTGVPVTNATRASLVRASCVLQIKLVGSFVYSRVNSFCPTLNTMLYLCTEMSSDREILVSLYNSVVLTDQLWCLCNWCGEKLYLNNVAIGKDLFNLEIIPEATAHLAQLCGECTDKYYTLYYVVFLHFHSSHLKPGSVYSTEVDGCIVHGLPSNTDGPVVGVLPANTGHSPANACADEEIAVGGKRKPSSDETPSPSKRPKSSTDQNIIPIVAIDSAIVDAKIESANDDTKTKDETKQLRTFREFNASVSDICRSENNKELLQAQQALWMAAVQTDLMTTLDEAAKAAEIENKKKTKKNRSKASIVVQRLAQFAEKLKQYQLWNEQK